MREINHSDSGGTYGYGRPRCGFTLIEMLVVIVVISLLMSILLPVLNSARSSARKAVCISNLSQTGKAIHMYSMDYNGSIPLGPKAPPFLSPADFYPSTGTPTSLISLRDGRPVGLGLLLSRYLSTQSKVVFCPASDQSVSAEAELEKVGTSQSQCSYYYRHASTTRLFDSAADPAPIRVPLSSLGKNRNNRPVRALVMDTQFLCPESLAAFNVRPRTHHRLQIVNILFAEGHVSSSSNADSRFTVDLTDFSEVRNAFSKILAVLEEADEE
ncbi:type II secretion system protein G [Limihaloglobus sulfuriphilus]|uniref:Type II secretion system protein G n=1 Tax=Limihaloglobus sulfuriphilus TaxID=1851148 RepID=A0A1Q2MGL3_9BACT|nr:prepilin-type N-terminal cleavage/methylation domain-containing protein [Limihaloglobus sulfuriphilus]AQQ71845.1 type II secretion system protein G [Limihaloglobus sulfuriphilus]